MFKASRANSLRDIISKKKKNQKKGWWSGSRCRSWVQTPVLQQKKKKERESIYRLRAWLKRESTYLTSLKFWVQTLVTPLPPKKSVPCVFLTLLLSGSFSSVQTQKWMGSCRFGTAVPDTRKSLMHSDSPVAWLDSCSEHRAGLGTRNHHWRLRPPLVDTSVLTSL
jgi:hypothetical protein